MSQRPAASWESGWRGQEPGGGGGGGWGGGGGGGGGGRGGGGGGGGGGRWWGGLFRGWFVKGAPRGTRGAGGLSLLVHVVLAIIGAGILVGGAQAGGGTEGS